MKTTRVRHWSPDEDAIEEIATRWLLERQEGLDDDRARAFAEWCGADPRHVEAVRRVERALALLSDLPGVAEAVKQTPPPSDVAPPVRALRWWLPAFAGLAAAAIIVLLLWRPGGQTEEKRYTTSASDYQRVALADGSRLELNANSEVQVVFSDAQRNVWLRTGEAHFNVAHDPERPFVVSVAGTSIRALGTVFNVRMNGTQLEVLVVEGRVQVEREGGERSVLAAGDRAVLHGDRPAEPPRIDRLGADAIRAALLWQQGTIEFSDTPLRDVVAEFNRRNRLQLVLEDAELGERRIGGYFALNEVKAFVRLLEQDGDVVGERRGDREIVLRRVQ